ncbi:hypothetical protein EI94DRAFT_1793103 [Lactarius quietus]|nr:hypothetical protein EI94DRAFT_1793103 [Lactarius quietus]
MHFWQTLQTRKKKKVVEEKVSQPVAISDEQRESCVADFIDATGNAAIRTATCAVCVAPFFMELNDVSLGDLRDKNLLSLWKAHPAHILVEGMLLHQSRCSTRASENGETYANVCASSLANGMWIGDVPLELKMLTLPERVLIARHFPAAYIVKLYPKKKGLVTGLRQTCKWLTGEWSETYDNKDNLQDFDISSPTRDEPQSIPLQSLGVVDVSASDVTQNEILASALANVTRPDKAGWLGSKKKP